MSTTISLAAICSFGLESLVAGELRRLGYTDLRVERGAVYWCAGVEAIARANLWLRCADRVLVVLGSFEATTFDELFEGVRALPWADWLPEDAEFPVSGKSVASQLASVPACQSVTKKAIVEALGHQYGRQHFEETGPRFRIQLALRKNRATLTLDTSGSGLHRRGYRDLAAPAPLRETLAAAMVLLSHWQPDFILADPCCGSGTLVIEAGLIGRNIAPGSLRTFDAFKWPCVGRKVWADALEEADDLAQPQRPLRLWASDIDPAALQLARHHAQRAGLQTEIEFAQRPAAQFATKHRYGYLLCNPPYGERLGDVQAAEQLYRELGQVYARLRDWSLLALTPHEGFEALFGREATHRRRLYNGRIRCTLYQYFGPRPPSSGSRDR